MSKIHFRNHNLALMLFAFLLFNLPVATVVKADDQWTSEKGYFTVGYKAEPGDIPLNQIHEWTLTLETASGDPVSGATVLADGGMPEHNHGLPTVPEVIPGNEPGQYILQGLRFHMMGYWEIKLTIETSELKDSLVISLEL